MSYIEQYQPDNNRPPVEIVDPDRTDLNRLSPPLGQEELRQYPDGQVERIFRSGTASMEALARAIADPLAHEIGSVVIQTERSDASGHPGQIVFDSEAIADLVQQRSGLLTPEQLASPLFDVTIGEPWVSPLGTTNDRVEAIIIPWTSGYDPHSVQMGVRPPTAGGRRILDQVLTAHDMQPHGDTAED